MGLFNFSSEQEHRVFNYKPIYFNKEKDELKQKFAGVDGSIKEEKEKYVPGSYLHGSLRGGAYQKTKERHKVFTIIGIINLALLLVVAFLIAKFYTLL